MGLDDEISTFKYPVSSANHEAHVNMYFWKIFDESILFKSLFKMFTPSKIASSQFSLIREPSVDSYNCKSVCVNCICWVSRPSIILKVPYYPENKPRSFENKPRSFRSISADSPTISINFVLNEVHSCNSYLRIRQ